MAPKQNEEIIKFNYGRDIEYTLISILNMLKTLNYDLSRLSHEEKQGVVFGENIREIVKQFSRDFGLKNSSGEIDNFVLGKIVEADKIIRAQKQLKILGYLKEEPTGFMTEETEGAIAQFKIDMNKKSSVKVFLKVDGRLDNDTINLLNEKVERINSLLGCVPVKINFADLLVNYTVDEDGTLAVNRKK
ncbi:MAG: peptidoglycan-binding domain-containing protein [Candidatus Micrarchaeia archaeon]